MKANRAILEKMKLAATVASKQIIKFPRDIYEIKDDNSYVTKADLESDSIIRNILSKSFPDIPIISEESAPSFQARKDYKNFFLIDPLDGTSAFVKNETEFSVNIAYLENNKPIIGVILSPSSGDLYYAIKNHGAYKNDLKINNLNKGESLIAIGSKYNSPEEINGFYSKLNITEIKKCSSALKFCYLAEGLYDVYLRLAGSKEWDIAAAEIILQESNCNILCFPDFSDIKYNKESYKNPYFIAFRNNIKDKILNIII